MRRIVNIYRVYSGTALDGSSWAAIGTMVRTRGSLPRIGTPTRCLIGTTMSGFAGICIQFALNSIAYAKECNAVIRYLLCCGNHILWHSAIRLRLIKIDANAEYAHVFKSTESYIPCGCNSAEGVVK